MRKQEFCILIITTAPLHSECTGRKFILWQKVGCAASGQCCSRKHDAHHCRTHPPRPRAPRQLKNVNRVESSVQHRRTTNSTRRRVTAAGHVSRRLVNGLKVNKRHSLPRTRASHPRHATPARARHLSYEY
jgi:hypothetical protein